MAQSSAHSSALEASSPARIPDLAEGRRPLPLRGSCGCGSGCGCGCQSGSGCQCGGSCR